MKRLFPKTKLDVYDNDLNWNDMWHDVDIDNNATTAHDDDATANDNKILLRFSFKGSFVID